MIELNIKEWGHEQMSNLGKDDFIYLAIKYRRFYVGTVQYAVELIFREGFVINATSDDSYEEIVCRNMNELIEKLGSIYEDASYMSLEEIRDELMVRSRDFDKCSAESILVTIGYINCQLDLGYEPTEAEMDEYKQYLASL